MNSQHSIPNNSNQNNQQQYQSFQPSGDFEQNQDQQQYQQQQNDLQSQSSMLNNEDFVTCPQHRDSKVTQICIYQQCNEPLCAQCVIQHKVYHQELQTTANIVSINQVRVENMQKLDQLLNLYNVNKNGKASVPLASKESSLNLLRIAKKHTYDIIEDYFKSLEQAVMGSQGLKSQNEYEHYKNLKSELEGQYYIQALLEIMENYEEFDINNKNINLMSENGEAKEISMNEAKIFSLKKELSDFVYLKDYRGKKVIEEDYLNSQKQGQSSQKKRQIFEELQAHNTQHNNTLERSYQQQQQQIIAKSGQHNKQPIFSSPQQQQRNSQQQQLVQSSINKHHHTQQQQIIPISHTNQNNKNTNNDIQINTLQNITKNNGQIPNHQARLNKLSNLDERLARLQNRLQGVENTRGQNKNNNSQKEKEKNDDNNNNKEETGENDYSNDIMDKIQNKYNIPNTSSYAQQNVSEVFNLEINGPDLFISNKMLVYFQENSKKLYTLDCSNKKVEVNDVSLKTENPSFKVPQHHKSVLTPDDGIFLIGGIFSNSPPFVSSDFVYNIPLGSQNLTQHSRMNYNRSNPGVCYNYNKEPEIYVCGGFEKQDENSTLDTFEKLDIRSGKWTSLRRCIYKSSGCTLVPFSKRYIFKFGGKSDMFSLVDKIEYYDSKTDEWHAVKLPEQIANSVQVASDLCAIQITDSQILFFGGQIHQAKSDKAYILEIGVSRTVGIEDDKFNIKRIRDMPIAACVRTQPIINEGTVMTFIDSSNMNDITISYYNRKCVCQFNGSTWKEL